MLDLDSRSGRQRCRRRGDAISSVEKSSLSLYRHPAGSLGDPKDLGGGTSAGKAPWLVGSLRYDRQHPIADVL
jgi:hypothetical protein